MNEKLVGIAYESDGEIVICGTPPDEPEGLDLDVPALHNCDEMGCGHAHVLYRFNVSLAVPDKSSLPAPLESSTDDVETDGEVDSHFTEMTSRYRYRDDL